MAITPQRGAGMGLNATYAVRYPTNIGGYANGTSGLLSLAPSETFPIPAGQYMVQPGPYSFIQTKDPINGTWRNLSQTPGTARLMTSDGVNFRVANLTGCAVGAVITNVGSGYTSAPTVSASAGSSSWTAIVGGAINSTVTITTAGAGYNYPPTLLFSAPPAGGVLPSAYCTVSAGAVASVVVVNQGAGYTTAPTITVIPDARDTITTTAVLTVNSTLAGSGTITAILCTNPGTPLTSVPTFTISGGGGASGAATAVMCWSVTGYTVGTAGAAYGNAQPILTLAAGGKTAATPGAVVNPQLGTDLFTPRIAQMISTSTAGGALTTGGVFTDAGLFQAVPSSITLAGNGVPTTQAVAALTMGGVTDQVIIIPV